MTHLLLMLAFLLSFLAGNGGASAPDLLRIQSGPDMARSLEGQGGTERNSGGPLTLLNFIVLVASLGTGFGLGLLVRRRRADDPPLKRANEAPLPQFPQALPAIHGVQQRWMVAGEHLPALVAAVARRAAPVGPVVLQPDPTNRAFHAAQPYHPSLFWLPEDRPEVDDLLAAVEGLLWMGPVTLLVEGPAALEAHAEDEAPDAVLRELLDECPPEVTVLVVVAEGTYLYQPPELRLGADDPRLAELLA